MDAQGPVRCRTGGSTRRRAQLQVINAMLVALAAHMVPAVCPQMASHLQWMLRVG
jgi:hypothetical protein